MRGDKRVRSQTGQPIDVGSILAAAAAMAFTVLQTAMVLTATVQTASAGGPRWVTGPPYFNTGGHPVIWYTDTPQYFTDPGSLSVGLDHATSDALVAGAAGVWNVSSARLVLGQGGVLNEHVSGADAYIASGGVVFPADVQPGNYLAKQIAVIYDRDGSVTDLLLGVGASDPSGCRQNAVTESVDAISASGFIQHAVLVLNGRCVGTAPETKLQMQYQLMRAFGRVLGLGWSQTNDNVFTQSPPPTYQQALHWPIMHPIDIVCGPYTYQCMPQPFTLRMDDIASLAALYFIDQGTSGSVPIGSGTAGAVMAGPAKADSLNNSNKIGGRLTFPTGQGMQGVNVLARRREQYWGTSEDWYSASSVSGYLYRRTYPNAVMGNGTQIADSMGSTDQSYEGFYQLAPVPIISGPWQDVFVETEQVNPLYTGQYAVGPYTSNGVDESGNFALGEAQVQSAYSDAMVDPPSSGAASSCDPGPDGMEWAPVPAATSGWWNGLLCGYAHSAWTSLTIKPNRSLTIEVTAEDEQGYATTAKAMPVIGVWQATDPIHTKPGVGAATVAFNGTSAGMTSLTVQNVQVAGPGPVTETLRMGIADQRGDGRPDFGYGARVLYADSIAPAQVSASGGVVTIVGTGFRPGNVVMVNGMAAVVQSWTANTIVATVPPSGALTAIVADVAVTDTSSGGTTVMSGAMTYDAPASEVLSLLSAPSGTVFVGDVAATAMSVRVTQLDGVTPVVGESIVFSATSGIVRLVACGGASCTVLTDAGGVAMTLVTPLGTGPVVLSAVGTSGGVTASFSAVSRARTMTLVRPVEYVSAGSVVAWQPQVLLVDNSAGTAGLGVNWLVTSGTMGLAMGVTVADGQGFATVAATVGPLEAGRQATGTACAWVGVCAGFAAQGVDAAALQLEVVSGGTQTVGVGAVLGPVVLEVTDLAGHPVAGAGVTVHQTVEGGSACPSRGRCPAASPVGSATNVTVSDMDGLVRVDPLQVAGIAEVTNMVAVTGTQGFVSLALQKQ